MGLRSYIILFYLCIIHPVQIERLFFFLMNESSVWPGCYNVTKKRFMGKDSLMVCRKGYVHLESCYTQVNSFDHCRYCILRQNTPASAMSLLIESFQWLIA